MAAPHDLAEQYALVTRHLILREYAQACSSLTTLLAEVPRPAQHPAFPSPSHASVDLAASSSTALDSLSSWSEVGRADDAALARWDAVDPGALRALKLAVTVYTSVYAGLRDGGARRGPGAGGRKGADAEAVVGQLPEELRGVIDGNGAGLRPLFAFIVHQCVGVLSPESSASSHPSSPSGSLCTDLDPTRPFHEVSLGALPPALLVTVVLAALKLAPPLGAPAPANSNSAQDATATARDLVEAWLAQVPDEVVLRWSRGGAGGQVDLGASHASLGSSAASSSSDSDPVSPPRAQPSATNASPARSSPAPRADHRADYLKLIELYVLELLPRQGDWDAAADWVRSDGVIGAKRREFMFRRLHAARAKVSAAQAQSSTRTPAPAIGVVGSAGSATSPRRGSTASSSESELTARPGDVLRRQIGGAATTGAGSAGRQQGLHGAAAGSTLGLAKSAVLNAESGADIGPESGSMSEESAAIPEQPSSIPAGEKGKARDPAERPTADPAPPASGFAALRARLSEFISAASARDHVAAAPNTPAGRRAQSPLAIAWAAVANRPYSVLLLVIVALGVRRAIARRRRIGTSAGGGASPGSASAATSLTDNEALQRRVRRQLAAGSDWKVQAGNAAWLALRKVRETIRMGTKITYV